VAGSYECGCQWGYLFDDDIEECVPNEVLIAAETQAYKQHTSTEETKPGKSSNSEVILELLENTNNFSPHYLNFRC
jgi:hypothetical protein